MTQTAIPFLFMRGGSSRGPYMKRSDLPEDRDRLSEVLISIVGAGHPFNIDGIGGGTAVTTKVAMLSKSADDWADVDYFFAQVSVEEKLVDYKPSCGNILVGVGPAAIEMGLVEPVGDVTEVRIRAVNTGTRVAALVQTPGKQVRYDGKASIDGVPGTAAPIQLQFMDVEGSATSGLFPTGHRKEEINGLEVSCMDVAMAMVIGRAEDFGITGYESAAELDANKALFERMEAVRLIAGERMDWETSPSRSFPSSDCWRRRTTAGAPPSGISCRGTAIRHSRSRARSAWHPVFLLRRPLPPASCHHNRRLLPECSSNIRWETWKS